MHLHEPFYQLFLLRQLTPQISQLIYLTRAAAPKEACPCYYCQKRDKQGGTDCHLTTVAYLAAQRLASIFAYKDNVHTLVFFDYSNYKHSLYVEIFVTMKQLNNALNPSILAQSRKLERLTMLLRNELPPECDGHYHAAAIHDNTLVIVTDSPVWTTRLRQLGPKILQLLKNKIPQSLQHVRIISRQGPAVSNHKPPVVKRELSQQSSQHIAQTASYIKDESLKKALLQISRHGQKKPPPDTDANGGENS